jgi:digeranylgeranylglycerophospholipid reductase
MKKYDLVIVGCGMAGAVAGLTALRKNLSVCIIEKKRRELVGRKTCGELTTLEVLEWLKREFNISVNSHPLKGLEICVSSGHRSHVTEPLCTIDRWQFGQLLVTELVKRGAEVVCDSVKGPVGKPVKGVRTKNSIFHSTVTIDCSGVSSVLRRKVAPMEPELLGVAYKEILLLKEPINTEYAMLMFDKNVIPAGYIWCFAKSEYELNVGAGGLAHGKASLKKKLETAIKNLKISVKKRESPGFGVIPLGGPLSSLVYPGLLVCGDAAGHVNPLTGEGIAAAVKAGHLAGMTAAEAVQKNDSSIEGMWQYNIDFAKAYGVIQVPLVVARDFLVSLSDESLSHFLENIITDHDLGQLIKGEVPGKASILQTFFHNWRKPRFLYQLYVVFSRMNKIRQLYEQYPAGPGRFLSWQKDLDFYLKRLSHNSF